jgi:ferredoxin-NADP reductase
MDPLLIRYPTTLKNRIHEYGDIYTFVFEKPNSLTFASGNYAHVLIPTVQAPDRSVREISFASAPQDSDITFSITTESKSPWQIKLLELQPGDTIELFKIKGHLMTPSSGTLVMIAQGIGITPFRSIIREHVELGTAISPILIHVGREAYLFEEELLKLSFEQHRVAREKLAQLLDDVVTRNKKAIYMIAGSPQFVTTLQQNLQEKGIRESCIQIDTFKGLPN